MPEIQIPDELKPDCGKCQGLCCVAMSHKRQNGFPIKEDKPTNVPCPNLETDPANEAVLYRCRIHDVLGQQGWVACTYFDCHGAGQAISSFFKELGFSWAIKSPELDQAKRDMMLKNLNAGYFVLMLVFGYLKSIHHEFGPARSVRYAAAREVATEIAKEFSTALTGDTEINIEDWYGKKFAPAMKKAADDVGSNHLWGWAKNLF